MYGIFDVAQQVMIASFVTPMTVKSNRPFYGSDSLSLKRRVSMMSAQRWEIETKLMPINNNQLFVHSVVNNYAKDVNIIMPQVYGNSLVQGRATGMCSTTAARVVGDDTVPITVTGKIPSGTFIKFGNHNKIYMTVTDIENNGSIQIYPTLRANVPSGTTVSHTMTIGTFRYDYDSVTGMSFSDGIVMDQGTVTFVESL